MRKLCLVCGLMCGVVAAKSTLTAADTHVAWTDPAEAGPDFLVQGEYTGLVGGAHPIAAQVIAVGNGEFEGVLYSGGLPGAGWDEKTRFYFKGRTADGVTSFVGLHGERLMFENPNFHAVLDGHKLLGEAQMFRNTVDSPVVELVRVHRSSPTLVAVPPPDAIVLFDGTSTDEWIGGRIVEQDLLDVGTETLRRFTDVQLHLEFRCPFMPTANGMARGNSGIYIKKEWEVQIIDSFGWTCENRKLERLSDFARCGGIHEMIRPRLNMCLPPLSWQTCDIEFVEARFDSTGRRTAPAMITARLNGVLVQDKFVLPPVAPGRSVGDSNEGKPGPILLQDHGNPVRFRNIWAIDKSS